MKIKANLIQSEIDRYHAVCAFTAQEAAVFAGRVAGKTVVQIADDMNVSMATVNRRLRSVKAKMDKADAEG